MFAKAYRYMDADGDGQISPAERDDFQQRMQANSVQYMEKFIIRFDTNRDGRVDEKEREGMVEGIQKELDQRIKRFDADGDGRLNPDETMRLMEDFVQHELGIKPSAARETEPPPGARP
jgi:hypothetical protein